VTARVTCGTCGTERREGDKFCHECGAPVAAKPAEYKQVTVLFADVVHSMDLAAAVGAERLREIMSELLDRCSKVVRRYGGMVDKFTGDGIMAVFGAPTALEDHALRACLAALGIHGEMEELAAEVGARDGITPGLRIGLNSGQVIAGEIGSAAASYTTIGEQVGMAQRMESVAPPGGVMLSESTARLVENAVVLGDPEMVQIKGAHDPVPVRRLLAIADHRPRRRTESALVGRRWELNTITAILDEAINGAGCVVNVMGPPGIGKSRLVRESAAVAATRRVEVITTHCESHTRDIPFHTLSRLLRAGTQTTDLDADASRAHIRSQFPDADPEDLVLLDDLLGLRDPGDALPDVAPDARRRRLIGLINSASLDRDQPTVYVIEDVHWIDDVSESMLADFLAVIRQTSSLTLITYRPEYQGALTRVSGAQTIALRPLSDAHAAELTVELLGDDPSVAALTRTVAERAAGNPFFAEEMVRDLAERGVLDGELGRYQLRGNVTDASVPATLHAAIGARIDRLESAAKRTLNAAAVIGTAFDDDLLNALDDGLDVGPLIEAELVDQVRFTPQAVYAFRHPMIRSVAYESQLKSDRAQLHRRLATAIEQSDENAALIAEHCEAAGDLHAAFEWHMRAGAWSNIRDNLAAAKSWRRAQNVADELPDDDPDRLQMRIAPRTLLCATGTRSGGSGVQTGFDELRELCVAADDERSLALGMAGQLMDRFFNGWRREASRLATEHVRLLESIGDEAMTLGLLPAAMASKHETSEIGELLRLAQRAIDLAAGDPTKGKLTTGSPLTLATAVRGLARSCLGIDGWKDDFQQAVAMARPFEAITRCAAMYYTHTIAIMNGIVVPHETTVGEAAETLPIAEQSGEDVALGLARSNLGVALVHQGGPASARGVELLTQVRETAIQQRYSMTGVQNVDIVIAQERAIHGDLDRAIELSRAVVDELFDRDGLVWIPLATAVLADALLQRGAEGDVEDARNAIDRMAAVPTEPGVVLKDIWLLRLQALLARTTGDAAGYRELADSYRRMATDLGFEGHIAMAKAMT
jgi:adenylate cyclase